MISTPRALVAAMVDAGVLPADDRQIILDRTLHRFDVHGDRPGRRNGWIRGDPAGAIFGSWKTGVQATWREARMDHANRLPPRAAPPDDPPVEIDREARAQRARDRAARLWRAATPAPVDHPYLVSKAIRPQGIRYSPSTGCLVVPARTADGVLRTLQFIAGDGGKRFLRDGSPTAAYFPIGRVNGVVLICEGFATAASLHEATDHATACAFSAGNIEHVARALRRKHPRVALLICADDDATPGNPGVTAATEAARAVGAAVVVPTFDQEPPP